MDHHEEDNALIEGDAPAAAMHAMIDANNHNQYFDFDATMMSVDDTLTMESGGHLMNHTNNHHATSQAGDVENNPPMTRQRKVSFGSAHPSQQQQQQQQAPTRQRRVDDGESSASDDQFQENPPVTAIAMPIDVTYYYDEESATTRDTEEGAISKMDGISFSSATGTMDDTGLNHRKFMASIPESQHPTNNSKPAVGNAVDAVPSEFEIKIQHNQGDSSSRIRQRAVQQGSAAGDALTNGAITDTASMTPSGGGGSSRSLSKLGKFHSRFTDRGKATSPRSSSPKTNKAVLHTKIAFITLLLFVASISSYILFTWLTATETTFARDQFTSIAERAVVDSANTVARKRLSMATMSTVISEQFRNQSDWPEVSVVGYDRIVNMLAQSGAHTNMGFAPIVKVSEQPSFEDFAYKYFDSREDYPNNTAINSPDWRGIWRIQKQNGTKTRIHDADEATQARQILTPIFHCCIDNPGDRVLLFNLYSEPNRRKTIDGILECAATIREDEEERMEQQSIFASSTNNQDQEDRQQQEEGAGKSSYPDYSCGSMTDFVTIVRFKTRGPASIMFQPVYPADDPWNVRGFILSPMAWDEVFETAFSNNVDGIYAVLESETEKWTYIIHQGRVQSFHEGDIHQLEYHEYGVSTNLTWNDLHESGAPMYKLSLYPSDHCFMSYSTGNAKNATIAALSIIILISILFLIYDYFVRKEFLERHQLLEAKRRFIRYVSHEVRTPLNAVLMGLSIIEAEMEPNTESTELLREVQNNTESAVDVLNDVLLYDKIESTLKLDISMVRIWQIVEHVLSEFRLPAARREVNLKATYQTTSTERDCSYDAGMRVKEVADLPKDIRCLRVAGDAARLTQVLRNLFSNALKFTPINGLVQVTASYHIESMAEERTVKWKGISDAAEKILLDSGEEVEATPSGHLQITVQDTGVGMTKEQLRKLFGEGVQFNAHDLQAGKGSGLGLFIAKGLVEQHKGTLTAVSEGIEKGSLFTLKLPLYSVPGLSPEEEEDPSSTSSEKGSTTKDATSMGSKGGLRLLVVDDHRSNRTLLRRLLERKGHQCDMAENGQIALEMVRDTMLGTAEPYDSILMDYEMPVMNGPTAASLIRELGSDVFIVGITGNVLGDDVLYFKSRGANAILPKPVQFNLLDELFMEHHLTY